jgi:hypothetical protein
LIGGTGGHSHQNGGQRWKREAVDHPFPELMIIFGKSFATARTSQFPAGGKIGNTQAKKPDQAFSSWCSAAWQASWRSHG